MKHYKTEIKEHLSLSSVVCDKCGKTMNDAYEIQECLSIHEQCGYGSVFGDGNEIELDLCQDCLKELLGDYIRVINR